ncbi:MAG: PrsW family glutamic-type intramembrane protease [Bryobacteraceae bacterium]
MSPTGQWYYLFGSETRGPIEADQLVQMILSNQLSPAVQVSQAGWQSWSPASSVFAAQLSPQQVYPQQGGYQQAPQYQQPYQQQAPQHQQGQYYQQTPQYQQPQQMALQAVQLKCVMGPDTGKAFMISAGEVALGRVAGIGQMDPQVAEQHVALSWRDNILYFQAFPGCTVMAGGAPLSTGGLTLGQQFRIGASTWQVGSQPVSVGGLLDSLGARLNSLASTEKLEGFSLKDMFSDVFKKRTQDELDDYFIAGTAKTTPSIEEVPTGWPRPWFFLRVLIFIGVVYLGFTVMLSYFPGNLNIVPGLIMMGSLAMPLATTILLFELNAPRNVSFVYVLSLLCVGGVVSLFIALIGFKLSGLSAWLGASSAGLIEETGKVLAVALIVRNTKYKYILNGLLFGAAVGAGFAAFESAGYAFRLLLQSGKFEVMSYVIQLRAFYTPFCHVAWTSIAAGALWRVKGSNPFSINMFFNPLFWRAFIIPVVLHMLWNAPFDLPFQIKQLTIGFLGWFVLFGLVQQGLRQVRDVQIDLAKEELGRTHSLISASGHHPILTAHRG